MNTSRSSNCRFLAYVTSVVILSLWLLMNTASVCNLGISLEASRAHFTDNEVLAITTKKHRNLLKDVQLLVPTFPGGFKEFNTTLVRSVEFFWPYDPELNIVVVLDDTTWKKNKNPNITEQSMTETIQSFFHRPNANVTVAYNPRSDQRVYGGGWFIQQLIMLWADNFTDQPYVGFADDDTVFTKSVLEHDLFDTEGRPRVVLRYQTDWETKVPWHRAWHYQSFRAFGEASYVNAMDYFPVIVKREHLSEIRAAMLQANPQFAFFDELYINLLANKGFSQFMLMFDHLWRHRRGEYSWHFEPLDPSSGPGTNKTFLRQGSPYENGITPEMLQPFPRCSMHASILTDYPRAMANRTDVVDDILRKGYCFSQPLLNATNHNKHVVEDPRCYSYDIMGDSNVNLEWRFDSFPTCNPCSWFQYAEYSVLLAHQERVLRNEPRQWDQDELSRVFDNYASTNH